MRTNQVKCIPCNKSASVRVLRACNSSSEPYQLETPWLAQLTKAGKMSFNDFLRQGLLEYIDVNEENNSLIALYELLHAGDDAPGDRALHSAGRSGRPHPLPPPQPVAAQHLPGEPHLPLVPA